MPGAHAQNGSNCVPSLEISARQPSALWFSAVSVSYAAQCATRFSCADAAERASSFNQCLLRVVPVLAMRAANLLTLAQSLLQLDMQQLIGVRNDPAFCADGPDLSKQPAVRWAVVLSYSVCRNECLYPFVARHSVQHSFLF